MSSFTPAQEAFNNFLGAQGYQNMSPSSLKYNFMPEGYSGMDFRQFNALRNSMGGGFGASPQQPLVRGQMPNVAQGPAAARTNYAAMMGRPMGQAPNWAQMAQNFMGGFQARPMGGSTPMPMQGLGQRYGPGQYNPLQSQFPSSPTPQSSGGKAGGGGPVGIGGQTPPPGGWGTPSIAQQKALGPYF